MGRQTEANLSEEAEQELLAFLRQGTDIAIFRSFAPTEQELLSADFGTRGSDRWSFRLWNKRFPWTPTYRQTRHDLSEASRRGLFYLSNASDGPIIEYTRANFAAGTPGRIYWAKPPSWAQPCAYDVVAFEAWYESVVRRVRRLTVKLPTAGSLG